MFEFNVTIFIYYSTIIASINGCWYVLILRVSVARSCFDCFMVLISSKSGWNYGTCAVSFWLSVSSIFSITFSFLFWTFYSVFFFISLSSWNTAYTQYCLVHPAVKNYLSNDSSLWDALTPYQLDRSSLLFSTRISHKVKEK